MSTTLLPALSKFFGAVAEIGISLFHSILAVLQAIVALCTNIIYSIVSLAQHIITMVLEVFQGVFGFVAANFVAIIVIGGGYYAYTLTQQKKGRTRK